MDIIDPMMKISIHAHTTRTISALVVRGPVAGLAIRAARVGHNVSHNHDNVHALFSKQELGTTLLTQSKPKLCFNQAIGAVVVVGCRLLL